MPSAETANGIWNLRVHDNTWWDSGKIDFWALAF
ncbi:proprotein convertase P-domain-containing protein [Streptomyces sanyensis]